MSASDPPPDALVRLATQVRQLSVGASAAHQVRRKELPPEYWEARRRALNHSRLQRNYARRRRRGDAMRQEEAQRMASMDEQQAAAYRQQREAERDAAKAAASAQRQQVAQAMQHGLRVVVDCSLSLAACHSARCDHDASSSGDAARASDREIRSLCKQLELCAAANKRATRPVSLQFASFTGAIRRFAVDAMHADRWPAAQGHEAALEQLFAAEQLVVLSPDAETPLLELDPGKVYVIGGLVDRTVQKGATLQLARRCGAASVRLPVAEHLGTLPSGRGVLNVNDCFVALLAVHAGTGWNAALEQAVPQRWRRLQQQQQQPMAAPAAGDAAADHSAGGETVAARKEQQELGASVTSAPTARLAEL